MKMFKIGCHLSASKGYTDMAEVSHQIGANTFQFFTRNPRGGKAKDINEEDIKKFHEKAKEYGIEVILAHAPYTLNCASKDENIRRFAKETMADDLKRMEYTPNNLYNFHPGSHVGQGVEQGTDYIVQMLNEIIKPEQTTRVLLETMAGKGTEIGRTFEELAAVYDGVVHNDKLRVCFDTCHTHDAGYDIVHDFDGVISHFDKIIGKDQIAVFHINDSKNPCGGAKDRHANIGDGEIGFQALHHIVHHPDFLEIPKILETPYLTDTEDAKKKYPPYKDEIEKLLQPYPHIE